MCHLNYCHMKKKNQNINQSAIVDFSNLKRICVIMCDMSKAFNKITSASCKTLHYKHGIYYPPNNL